jgi:hypothetical protein
VHHLLPPISHLRSQCLPTFSLTGPEHRVAAQQDNARERLPHADQADAPGEVEPRKHATSPGPSLQSWRHLLHMSAQ